jgi:hypothetical protein
MIRLPKQAKLSGTEVGDLGICKPKSMKVGDLSISKKEHDQNTIAGIRQDGPAVQTYRLARLGDAFNVHLREVLTRGLCLA